MNLCLILYQPAQIMSLLWRYILMHKMNVFCSDCTWIRPVPLHTLPYCTLLSLSFDSHAHRRMPLLKAVQDAYTNITLLTVIQGASCFSLQGTHTTVPLLAFGRPVLWMFDFQSAKLGWRWVWSASRHATDCHIGFMALYYQIKYTGNILVSFFQIPSEEGRINRRN
jgi:hypothetical protein